MVKINQIFSQYLFVSDTIQFSKTAEHIYKPHKVQVSIKLNKVFSHFGFRPRIPAPSTGRINRPYILPPALTKNAWWARMESNHRPHGYQQCALAI